MRSPDDAIEELTGLLTYLSDNREVLQMDAWLLRLGNLVLWGWVAVRTLAHPVLVAFDRVRP